MRGKRKLPDHIPGTSRAWKQRKRREWKAVLKAIDTFRMGCAYTPAYDRPGVFESRPWVDFEKLTKEIAERLSFKTWGR